MVRVLFLLAIWLNPLIPTLKPQSNERLYSKTVIGTLAVDGWDVTFGTARRGLGSGAPLSPLLAVPNVTAHPSTANVPTSYCLMWHYNCLWTLKGQPSRSNRQLATFITLQSVAVSYRFVQISFFSLTIRDWNLLPSDLQSLSLSSIFRSRLQSWSRQYIRDTPAVRALAHCRISNRRKDIFSTFHEA